MCDHIGGLCQWFGDLPGIVEPKIPEVFVEAPRINPNGWIQTYGGKKFYPEHPRAEDITIRDIAHALSNTCRFTGHCRVAYSVAQHSVLVSLFVSEENQLWGLLHDSSEAFCTDIASPIKRLPSFAFYREIEANIQRVICEKFGLPPEEPREVKRADTAILAAEARDLMAPLHVDWKQPTNPPPYKIVPLPPMQAEALFLARFEELMKRHIGEENFRRYMDE